MLMESDACCDKRLDFPFRQDPFFAVVLFSDAPVMAAAGSVFRGRKGEVVDRFSLWVLYNFPYIAHHLRWLSYLLFLRWDSFGSSLGIDWNRRLSTGECPQSMDES